VSPEVVRRKLALLSRYLDDLSAYRDVDFAGFMSRHYEIERLLDLLVAVSSDIVLHLLANRGEDPPGSYRAAFLRPGEVSILPAPLAERLARGAGLRNILAHEYEKIDYALIHKSIPVALNDFREFVGAVSALA
jgi:uncharacterized protein YutE (UPF0331/DUF86 family)